MKKIGVLLSQINGTQLTSECLSSLNECTYENINYYVGDNFSDSLDIVTIFEKYPNVNFFLYKKRLNYCETFNYLANKAISDGCEFIFMVNNDTKNFSMDYFEQIISTFEDRQVGMVGSACLDYENNAIHSSNKLKNKFGESVVIPTEGFIVRASAWKSVGGLDERLEMYGEDIKLIADLNKYGWKIKSNYNVSFAHLGGATVKNFPYMKIYLRTRNGVLLLRSFKLPTKYKMRYLIDWILPTLKSLFSSNNLSLIVYTPLALIVFIIGLIVGLVKRKLN